MEFVSMKVVIVILLILIFFYEGEGKEFGADGQTLMFHGNYYKGKRHGKGLVYKNMRVDNSCYWCNGHKKMAIIVVFIRYYLLFLLASLLSLAICISITNFVGIFIICISPLVFGGVFFLFAVGILIYRKANDETSLCQPYYKVNYSNLRNETNEKGVAYTRPLNDTKTIDIFDECFPFASEFRIDGLNRLKTIKIGNNSFTQEKNSWGNYRSKSFHILNCESLESIQIGEYSFSDFGGNFELKNLPQLRFIKIGTIGINSSNFYCSSFVIRGIELILSIIMIRSSKSTIH